MVRDSSIQLPTGPLPPRIKLRHNRLKSVVMARLQQVSEFMHHNILYQLPALLHQLNIEADIPTAMATAAPAGLHVA